MDKMTVQDFVDEYNWMCSSAEVQSEDIVRELYSEVSKMFELNCGTIPNFELINGGKEIKLL